MLSGLKLGTVEMFVGATTWLGAFETDFRISGTLHVFDGSVPASERGRPEVALVCAGTSDLPVPKKAERTLVFNGVMTRAWADVGVAGLWRLLAVAEDLSR